MSILNMDAQFQWDYDSRPWQSDNCRPTVGAMIAGYYTGRHVSPHAMRIRMQGGSSRSGPTNTHEEVFGLASYGVPATSGWKSVEGVKSMLRSGVPLDISVNYGRIPRDRRWITDFQFYGAHSVLAAEATTQNGVAGLRVRDPNHGSKSRPERPDYTFWPDYIWKRAYVSDSTGTRGIAVWPLRPAMNQNTPATTYEHIAEVVIDQTAVREKPTVAGELISRRAKGARLKTSKLQASGGTYVINGISRRDWLGYQYEGQTVWIARGAVRIVS